jgi:hypothetical protein
LTYLCERIKLKVSLSEIGDDSSPHVRPPVRVVVTGHDSRLIHAWRAVGHVTSRAPLRPGFKCTHANAMDHHHLDRLLCPAPAGGHVLELDRSLWKQEASGARRACAQWCALVHCLLAWMYRSARTVLHQHVRVKLSEQISQHQC